MKFLVRYSNRNDNRNSSLRDSSRWAFEEFKNQYELKEFMGEGCFGKVHKVRSRIRNRSRGGIFNLKQQFFACKTIQKSKLDDINMLKEECSNLEDVLGHPHLLQFEQTFEDDKEVHIISELLEGGELYEAIIEMKKRRAYFPENDSAWMVRNILDGLSYCHDVIGIVHRDLKASNFMFKRKIETAGKNKRSKGNKSLISENLREIKIIDFGLSTKIDQETGKVQGCLGTPYYVAPEVLTEEPYDNKCDVWSAGVIAHLILSRQLPYQGKDEEETVRFLSDAENHQPKYNSKRWMTLDPMAVDFCKSLLQVDPSKRPTAREAMSHPWIVKHCGQVPTQRPRINLEHSIRIAPSEDETLIGPISQSFDSQRSSCSHETHKTSVFFEGIPDEQEERRDCSTTSSKSRQKRNPLQRLFSPSKNARTSGRNISFISNKDGKSPRTRQKTLNTLILEE
mmetsp:Transcript_6005/g.14548  ORF Transcript_6005/g.14548 Transcript_6005/m.14548 type:complete len:453 (-) Transcript_6005:163-1521(-)